MKKITVLLIGCFSTILAQTSDPIQELYSDEVLVVKGAVVEIMADSLTNAIPVMETLITSKNISIQLDFLRALSYFNAPGLENQVYTFIERVDTFSNLSSMFPIDTLAVKAEGARILFSHGNFTLNNYIFDLAQIGYPNFTKISALYGLCEIVEGYPPKENDARIMLENIMVSNDDSSSRYMAFATLADNYGWQMGNQIINAFKTDPYFALRLRAFRYLMMYKNENSQLESLLKEQLNNDPSPTLRSDIADSLLYFFGSPSNLKLVKDRALIEHDSVSAGLMSFTILEFIPALPYEEITSSAILDSLQNYIRNELYDYEWIDSDSKDYHLSIIDSVQNFITQNDLSSADSLLTEAVQTVNEELNTKAITREGYKYLKYYYLYAIDRL